MWNWTVEDGALRPRSVMTAIEFDAGSRYSSSHYLSVSTPWPVWHVTSEGSVAIGAADITRASDEFSDTSATFAHGIDGMTFNHLAEGVSVRAYSFGTPPDYIVTATLERSYATDFETPEDATVNGSSISFWGPHQIDLSAQSASQFTAFTSETSRKNPKSCLIFDDRLLFFRTCASEDSHTTDVHGAGAYTFRNDVYWSVRGNMSDFSSVGAGFELLPDMEGRIIHAVNEGDRALLFSDKQVWEMRPRRDLYGFDFRKLSDNVGLSNARAVKSTPYGTFFADPFHRFWHAMGNEVNRLNEWLPSLNTAEPIVAGYHGAENTVQFWTSLLTAISASVTEDGAANKSKGYAFHLHSLRRAGVGRMETPCSRWGLNNSWPLAIIDDTDSWSGYPIYATMQWASRNTSLLEILGGNGVNLKHMTPEAAAVYSDETCLYRTGTPESKSDSFTHDAITELQVSVDTSAVTLYVTSPSGITYSGTPDSAYNITIPIAPEALASPYLDLSVKPFADGFPKIHRIQWAVRSYTGRY
jgi:hypothetical protein